MKPLRRYSDRDRNFHTVARRLNPNLYRYAIWCGCDAEYAADVIRNSLLQAWQSVENIENSRRLMLWLLTEIRLKIRNVLKKDRRSSIGGGSGTDLCNDMNLSGAKHSDRSDMRGLLVQLEINEREPLVLQILLGLTLGEIAELMGLQRDEVLARLSRARERLFVIEQSAVACKKDEFATTGRHRFDPAVVH